MKSLSMKFSQYMSEWLYGDKGYYTKYNSIGKEGDFYTAVSSSKFFGGSIAKHIIAVIDEGFLSKECTIVEVGAHHGYLMADIIEFIYTLRPELLETLNFCIVERYEALQNQQKKYFAESFGGAVNLLHVNDISALRVNEAFILANEIFDAFECELFYKGKIGTVENHEVVFEQEDEQISTLAKKYHKDRGEIAVGYESFASHVKKSAKTFEFMSFDYGDMQARPDFSIRIYHEHKVDAFFEESINRAKLFQTSDITYDVNFEHVKDAFIDADMNFVSFQTQMVALVEFGILELLEIVKEKAGEDIYQQELQKIKTLIMPDMMGERFKVIRFRSK